MEAAGEISKIFLQAPVYIRPGADGYGLESTFADQPRNAGGIPVQITKIALTFNGQASKGSFMRMPTSCAEGTSLSRANSWEAPTLFSERDLPDDADRLRLARASSPTAARCLGAPGATDPRHFPPRRDHARRSTPRRRRSARAEVILPPSLSRTSPPRSRACPRAQADASDCPESSSVGTAIIDSPLQPQPVRGPVYIAFNSDAPLPGLS